MCELLKILQEMHPEVDYAAHQTLIDDKILDSFDIITLVAEVNDRMDIAIPAEELVPENFNSYAALLALVERLEEEQ
ncbi:MAG: acyl carrier protein [Defluviitaleaceae bacterium]|nr:acyl carrier protein [Defluviitaleaceae bacterium]